MLMYAMTCPLSCTTNRQSQGGHTQTPQPCDAVVSTLWEKKGMLK